MTADYQKENFRTAWNVVEKTIFWERAQEALSAAFLIATLTVSPIFLSGIVVNAGLAALNAHFTKRELRDIPASPQDLKYPDTKKAPVQTAWDAAQKQVFWVRATAAIAVAFVVGGIKLDPVSFAGAVLFAGLAMLSASSLKEQLSGIPAPLKRQKFRPQVINQPVSNG